jgi:hypothetical protein
VRARLPAAVRGRLSALAAARTQHSPDACADTPLNVQLQALHPSPPQPVAWRCRTVRVVVVSTAPPASRRSASADSSIAAPARPARLAQGPRPRSCRTLYCFTRCKPCVIRCCVAVCQRAKLSSRSKLLGCYNELNHWTNNVCATSLYFYSTTGRQHTPSDLQQCLPPVLTSLHTAQGAAEQGHR